MLFNNIFINPLKHKTLIIYIFNQKHYNRIALLD